MPVHPDDRWLLGMVWENQLFVDVALPFGLKSAPMIFSALADGLEFMIRQAEVDRVGHYLDDFVLVGPPGSRDCSRFLQVALRVCKDSELQSLAGHLNHACKVVRPGRRFLRGVFGLIPLVGPTTPGP